jgi:putative MATE family efflux protein
LSKGIGQLVRRGTELYRDGAYFTQLYHLAAPIALQNLLANSLNMVASVMVGQLGEASMAAVGLAGQVFFLLILILFGISSGSAMFTAQLWGNKDIVNLRKVLGLCIILGLGTATLFFLLSEFFPEKIMGIFTTDQQVITLGSAYLQISAWGFIFFSVTSGFAAILRSIGEVKLPMTVSVSALILNITLSYVLIFGKFGLPALGIEGAAYGVVIARIVECLALVYMIYRKRLPVAAKISEMLGFNLSFVGKVFKPVLPVILNELLWSTAVTMYSIVYARIGTSSIAAMNIVGTVDAVAIVPFMGLSSAIAIMAGNKIGAGDDDDAYRSVGRTLGITVSLGILIGGLVLLTRSHIVSLYKVSPEVVLDAERALIILGLWMTVRSLNMILVVGTLRSGGDTRYSLFLDGVIIWILGVPMAVLGGLVLHLPVYWVYLMVMSEELTKCVLGIRRYFSRKWIHHLTEAVNIPSPIESLLPPHELNN